MKGFGTGLRRSQMALMVAMALSLAGCGGGSNVRPAPPPTVPDAPPPTPPPSDPNQQPPLDAQLSITHAYDAHDQGYTGAGVTIGVIDSGINRNHPALRGRVTKQLVYIDPNINNTQIDDVVGHGTWVSQIAAGKAFDRFPGGLAPGASLVSARIIADKRPEDDGSGKGNEVTAEDAQFFAQTLNPALISAGVNVMNNSWGGIYWDTSNAAINRAFAEAYEPFVLQHDGLVVFSSGNESFDQPSDIASLPSLAPQLERGWLVAVAVDSNNPTQLASYSNACGRAMDYCLAAPGNVIVSDKDAVSGSKPDYWIVRGTSFSAPIISGAAALVWDAYPYFNNDLVRQTLLGTADDLGEPGVDPVFGHGELNVGRAVNGPAKFDWGNVTVDFSGDSSWNNPITGAGGLIKRGSGTLSLTDDASYTGTTQIQGGMLTAKSLASAVNIGAQGILAQTPSITGSIINEGVLGVSGGDVTVTGDYAQQGNGRLALSLGSALRVTGKASLNGGDLYVLGTEPSYVANAHTDVLSASGGLSGTFSALNKASNVVLLNATLNYDANNAWLNVSQVQASAVQGVNYTAATFGAAQRVDVAFEAINTQLGGGGHGLSASFVDGAGRLQRTPTAATLDASLQSLSGQLHAASAAMTFEAIDAGTRVLSDRFDQLLVEPRAGSWTQGIGYHGGMSRSGYNNVGYDLGGTLLGQDMRLGANGIAGYALSQTRGLGRLAETAEQGRSRGLEAMLYGGTVRGSWYTMGRLGVGNYHQSTRRQLQLGSQFAGVTSDSNGRYGVAYGESGYAFGRGGTRLTPYVNLQYAQLRRNGFNETGAWGFGLKSGAQTTSRWQAGLGVRAAHQWSFAGGSRLTLQGRALWQQAFGLHGEVFDASFSGVDQFAPLTGIGLSRYGAVFSTTLNWQVNPRANLQLGYDRYTGQRQSAQMATANFRWSF